jgi:hypothetical protein
MQIEIFDKVTKESYGFYENVENVYIEDNTLMIDDSEGNRRGSYSLADFTFKGTNND